MKNRSSSIKAGKKVSFGKKLLISLFGGGVVLVVLMMGGLHYMTSKGFLIQQIEENISARVEIGKVKVELFSSPARLLLKDVKLSDKNAEDIRTASSYIKVEEVDLQVSLWSLLSRHIQVSKMSVKRAQVVGTIMEEGGNSLERLFEKPGKQKKHLRQKQRGAKHPKRKRKQSGFNVFDQEEFIASLDGFEILQSSFDLTIEKSGLRIQAKDVNITLDALKIDPKHLEESDKVTLHLSADVGLYSTSGWQYVQLNLSGQANARLFDVETGYFEPDVTGAFALGDDAWVSTRVPAITSLWKELDRLKDLGIRVKMLPLKATFGRSQSLSAHYYQGKITVNKSLSLWINDWEVAVLNKSWFQTETNQHDVRGEILASKKISKNLVGLLNQAVDYLPSQYKKKVSENLGGDLFRDGRFVLSVRSRGELSHPKVWLIDGVPNLKKSVKKAAKKLLEKESGGLLKSIFK